MANPEQLKILRHGSVVWNAWRKDNFERHDPIDFSGADLSNADLKWSNLSYADLTEANLSGAHLYWANLDTAKLIGADLTNAHLQDTNLVCANLGNAMLVGALLRGGQLGCANLSHANLSEADLEYTQLMNANLSNANLSNANLSGARLGEARLIRTNLGNANLRGSNLSFAMLDGADLSDARLVGVNFKGAILTGANFSRAQMGTVLGNVDLREVIGLENVLHNSPSTIGIDTLYRSQGDIPDNFLLGAGVPEESIDIARLIRAGPPIQWYSCFISYSTKDEDFAQRLRSRMRKANMRVWLAPEDLKGGRKLHEQLFEAIQAHDRLLLVLSEHSIRSEWVMTEIRKARAAEKNENRRKLFPIRLTSFETLRDWTCFDADSGKDLAVEVREYFIPDFSNWKDDDAFENAFAGLQKDLKEETKPHAKTHNEI